MAAYNTSVSRSRRTAEKFRVEAALIWRMFHCTQKFESKDCKYIWFHRSKPRIQSGFEQQIRDNFATIPLDFLRKVHLTLHCSATFFNSHLILGTQFPDILYSGGKINTCLRTSNQMKVSTTIPPIKI
jgi:hypothetical protein